MTVIAAIPEPPECVREFRRRCASIGLPTWTADARGRLLSCPRLDGPFGEWLRGPTATRAVMRLLADANISQEWIRHEPWLGCTLVAVPHVVRRATIARTIVMIAGSSATHANLSIERDTQPRAIAESASQIEAMLRWTLDDLARADADRAAIDGFTRELSLVYEHIRLLYTLARSMKTTATPEDFVALCCDELRDITGYTWVSACLRRDAAVVESLRGVAMCAGDPACDRQRFIELAARTLDNIEGPGFTIIRTGDTGIGQLIAREAACHAIIRDDNVIGAVLAANEDPHFAGVSSVETQLFDVAADLLGVFLDNAGLYADQRSLFFGSLRALTAAIDAKDRYTCGHSERVAHLAARLAEAVGHTPDMVERVHIAGLLHDIGKIGVPESVLTFPGRLSDEQFAFIKQHPEIGHRILSDIRELDDVKPGVLTHHERWDGRGYPRGLAGKDIPLLGRILALADTFDAMSSSRSYRPAMPREKVLAEIQRCAGSQFDPALAAAFLRLDFGEFDAMVARHAGEYAHQLPLAKSA